MAARRAALGDLSNVGADAAAQGGVKWDPPPPAENNECSNAYTRPPGGAALGEDGFDCPAFVIASTDATWHPRSWEATNRAVDK